MKIKINGSAPVEMYFGHPGNIQKLTFRVLFDEGLIRWPINVHIFGSVEKIKTNQLDGVSQFSAETARFLFKKTKQSDGVKRSSLCNGTIR